MGGVFGIPNWEQFIRRTIVMLVACPKIFFAAFTWEGFGILASNVLGLSDHSAGYYFMTGLGTFIGVLGAQLFILACLEIYGDEWEMEFQNGLLLATASGLAAGTMWQLSVNIAADLDMSFTEGFFFVFMMSASAFLLATILIRGIIELMFQNFKHHISPVRAAIWYDIQLALSIGAADAFFLGTDDLEFVNGWLPDFDVTSTIGASAVMVALLLSGVSALCGFLILQSLLNVIIEDVWTDVSYKENESLRQSTEQLYQSSDNLYQSAENLFTSKEDLTRLSSGEKNKKKPTEEEERPFLLPHKEESFMTHELNDDRPGID